MIFNNPLDNNDGKKPTKGGIFRFLFAPEFGRGVRPIGMTFQMFLQMLAALFLSVGLLERSHRFFKPNAQLSMAEIFNETWARFDWRDKNKLPQNLMFIATWGLIGSTLMWFVVLILGFVLGASPAHAQDGAFFSEPTGNKVGLVIDSLVLGNQLGPLGGPATSLFQELLRKMLGVYSKAMLVFASFMLLYHVLNLVVSSAWSGKPLDGADQVWAPLRLVLAIGLLVPLSTGLNTAQYAVLEVAKLGSNLASQVWLQASKSFAPDPKTPTPEFIPSTRMATTFHDMVMIHLCQADINTLTLGVADVVGDGDGRADDGNILTSTGDEIVRGYPSWFSLDGNKQMKFGAGYNQELCGTIKWPEIPGYAGVDAPDPADTVEAGIPHSAIVAGYKHKIATAINKHFKKLDGIACMVANTLVAKRYYNENPTDWNAPITFGSIQNMYNNGDYKSHEFWGTDMSNTINESKDCAASLTGAGGGLGYVSLTNVHVNIRNAIRDYENEVKAIASEAYGTLRSDLAREMSADDPLGWMTAGTRYMRIAMLQRAIHDAVDLSPSASVGELFKHKISPDDLKKENSDGANENHKRFIKSIRGADRAENRGQPYSHIVVSLINKAAGIGIPPAGTPLAIPKMLADVTSLQPQTYMDSLSAMESSGGGGLIEGVLNFISMGLLSWDKATVMNLIAPGMADPLPNLFSFGNMLYWCAISFTILAALVPGGLGMAMTIGPILFPIAIMLAFILPLTPMVRFLMAVFSWLLAVLEAVIGMPLFALAHLSPKAEGLMGNAKGGYMLLMSIALRPVLLIFGLVAAIIMLTVGMFLLNYMFRTALDAIWGEGKVFFLTAIIFGAMYAMHAYAMCNACFKIIDEIADKSMQWFGGSGYSFRKADDAMDEAAVLQLVKGGVGALQSGVGGINKALHGAEGKAGLLGKAFGGKPPKGGAPQKALPSAKDTGDAGGTDDGGGGNSGGGGGTPMPGFRGRLAQRAGAALGNTAPGRAIGGMAAGAKQGAANYKQTQAERGAEMQSRWNTREEGVNEKKALLNSGITKSDIAKARDSNIQSSGLTDQQKAFRSAEDKIRAGSFKGMKKTDNALSGAVNKFNHTFDGALRGGATMGRSAAPKAEPAKPAAPATKPNAADDPEAGG